MAHNIQLYCTVAGLNAEQALDALVRQAKNLGTELTLRAHVTGPGWALAANEFWGTVPYDETSGSDIDLECLNSVP